MESSGKGTQELILVNESDDDVGTAGMLQCHSGRGVLHRAFTIFISNSEGKVLIQRRSEGKLLWPSTWETSCSGHPHRGEDMVAASEKRLFEELGFRADLAVIDRFRYRAAYGDVGSECEICYLLVGRHDGEVRPDPDEVSEFRWVEITELQGEIARDPGEYAPWLAIGLDMLAQA